MIDIEKSVRFNETDNVSRVRSNYEKNELQRRETNCKTEKNDNKIKKK